MTFPEGAFLRVRSNVTWREVGGEVIALDLVTSTYFSTNRTGSVLWHVLVEGATRQELIKALQAEFGIDEAVAETDVRTFLRLLEDHRLLEEPG